MSHGRGRGAVGSRLYGLSVKGESRVRRSGVRLPVCNSQVLFYFINHIMNYNYLFFYFKGKTKLPLDSFDLLPFLHLMLSYVTLLAAIARPCPKVSTKLIYERELIQITRCYMSECGKSA